MTNNQCPATAIPLPNILPAIIYQCTKTNCDGIHSAPMKWRRLVDGEKIVEEIPNDPHSFTWTDDYARTSGWQFEPGSTE